MQTTVTARHCEIADDLRERAEAVLARLATYAARPHDGAIVFDVEGLEQTAEIRFHDAGGEVMVAGAAAADHRTALDRAEDKLKRQLEKAFGRPRRPRKPTADQV